MSFIIRTSLSTKVVIWLIDNAHRCIVTKIRQCNFKGHDNLPQAVFHVSSEMVGNSVLPLSWYSSYGRLVRFVVHELNKPAWLDFTWQPELLLFQEDTCNFHSDLFLVVLVTEKIRHQCSLCHHSGDTKAPFLVGQCFSLLKLFLITNSFYFERTFWEYCY